MFDRILEHTRLLGLDEPHARRLLGMLVAQVFNPDRGGAAGFVQAFRDQGLGDAVDSWLGAGSNHPLDGERLERVLGTETIARMADRLGMPTANVRAAAAAMLPDVIHELSEHGDLPDSVAAIPDRFHGWFGGTQEHLRNDLGHIGAAALEAGAVALGGSVGVVGDAHMAAAAKVIDDASPAAAPEPLPPPVDPPQGSTPTPTRAGPARPMAIWLLLIVVLLVGFAIFRGCSRTAEPGTTLGMQSAPETHDLTG
ncbi:YidB family protein [Lysobacter korlensis]|uniref:YidB family protein n=1 Tax=Lysobacter korlensis TaxID=553636 RepID=A0ABV6RQ23_9GAMM